MHQNAMNTSKMPTLLHPVSLALVMVLLSTCSSYAISKKSLLEKIDKAWSEIDDFSATMYQRRVLSINERTTYFRADIKLLREPSRMRADSFRIIENRDFEAELERKTPSDKILTVTDETVYFSGKYWYVYDPSQKVVVRSTTLTNSFIPHLAAIAGITKLNPKEFDKQFHMDAPVKEELLGRKYYRVLIEARKNAKGTQPFTKIYFWFDQETYLPFKIETVEKGEGTELTVYLKNTRANKGLTAKDLEFKPPGDTYLKIGD
jgi:outer membrane lipoprotein-sorting protein